MSSLSKADLDKRWVEAIPVAKAVAKIVARGTSIGVEDLTQELLLRFPEVVDEPDLREAFTRLAKNVRRKHDPIGIGPAYLRHEGGYPDLAHFGNIEDATGATTRLRDERQYGHECYWCGEFTESPKGGLTCSRDCSSHLTRYTSARYCIGNRIVDVVELLRLGPQPSAKLMAVSTSYIACLTLLRKLGYEITRHRFRSRREGDKVIYTLVREGVPLPHDSKNNIQAQPSGGCA